MPEIFQKKIYCPYCGEIIDLLIDNSEREQDYIEDCQVCCRPIQINLTTAADGSPVIIACHENE